MKRRTFIQGILSAIGLGGAAVASSSRRPPGRTSENFLEVDRSGPSEGLSALPNDDVPLLLSHDPETDFRFFQEPFPECACSTPGTSLEGVPPLSEATHQIHSRRFCTASHLDQNGEGFMVRVRRDYDSVTSSKL